MELSWYSFFFFPKGKQISGNFILAHLKYHRFIFVLIYSASCLFILTLKKHEGKRERFAEHLL